MSQTHTKSTKFQQLTLAMTELALGPFRLLTHLQEWVRLRVAQIGRVVAALLLLLVSVPVAIVLPAVVPILAALPLPLTRTPRRRTRPTAIRNNSLRPSPIRPRILTWRYRVSRRI